MTARASTCLLMGVLLTGCPFALDDGYFIDEDAAAGPSVPVVADPVPPGKPPPPPKPPPPASDAAPPADAEECSRKTPCLAGYECRGKDCEKVQ